jgi:CHASE1-domain containing sensor protein
VARLLVVILGTLTSLLLALRVWGTAKVAQQVEFSQRATAAAIALQRSMQTPMELVYSIAALYATSPVVKRAEFQEFTRGPLQRYADIQALGWIPRVADAEREAYAAMARKEGLGDFQIIEHTPQGQVMRATRRDVYYPLFYVEPLLSNPALLGFNLGSDPTWLTALQSAIRGGEIVASPWINLAPDTGERFCVFLFLPIYKSGMPYSTWEERRTSLQGFALIVMRLSILAERAVKGIALGDMDLRLTDVTDAASRNLLHLQIRTAQAPLLTFPGRQGGEAETVRTGLHWETAFPVAGRRWSVLASPPPAAAGPAIWPALGSFVGGLSFSILVATCLQRRRA